MFLTSLCTYFIVCAFMKEQQQQKNPNKRTEKKGFVLYFNCKIANPRIMFTFMFSVVQCHDHLIQTSAFSSLAALVTKEGTGAVKCPWQNLAKG